MCTTLLYTEKYNYIGRAISAIRTHGPMGLARARDLIFRFILCHACMYVVTYEY